MDTFELPVLYKGEEISFPTRLVTSGYAMRFVVLVNDLEVVYERDDAGEFRAVLPNANEYIGKLPDRALLEAIHNSIATITS